MANYYYKKDKPKYVPLASHAGSIYKRKRDPIWQFLKKRKREQLILAGLLTIVGIGLLGTQLVPMAFSSIQAEISKQYSQVESPVSKTYAQGQLAYYDVNKSYFGNLVDKISRTDGQQNQSLVIDQTYNKKMMLNINSIGIENLSIAPNVDSYNEDIYNQALKGGAAHFKGTVLPGDNQNAGNFVIYGHSALPSFFESNPNYDETEFTKLHKIRVGDKIEVERDGQLYEYVVTKNEVVEPSDFDILESEPGQSTMTLITCFPAGDPSGRWITKARQVN